MYEDDFTFDVNRNWSPTIRLYFFFL